MSLLRNGRRFFALSSFASGIRSASSASSVHCLRAPAAQLVFMKYSQASRSSSSRAPAAQASSPAPVPMSAPLARVQKPAPNFKEVAVVGQDFKEISLSDYKGKYVVLFFYPLDFTFVCPTEIIAFSDAAAEFKKLNCELIAASVDSKYSHLAWINTPRKQGGLGPVNFPIIADLSKKISQDYGVLIDDGHSLRGTFIIDGNGIIRHITMNDPPVGRSVQETLRLVQAYQYADQHGEVCPVGWTPGQKTMKDDPVKSKEYFSAVYH